jgi:serine/threonine protein kinase/WD40 repeat protein
MTDRDLFIAALDHADAIERAAWLDRHCAGDPDRRRRVEVLLAAHEHASRFLADPAVRQLDQPDDPTRTSHPADETTPASAIDVRAFLQPPEKPGQLGKLEHYEVLEVVGTGGMGVVVKAFDPKLHRLVAIKLMAPHLAAHGAARKRFEREAKAVAAVKNEHVVAIYGVEPDGPVPYLVMEFVGGVSLQERIEKRGPLDVKEILRIGMQAARGLAAAHSQGVIHRDVKPANILLENGVERLKLTDFGLARMADDANLTQSGTITGTPNYMSPEQAAGSPVDARGDLFSLGSVLYALCTGHPPFRAETPLAVVRRVCDDPARPVREVNPDVPEWLEAIVRKLLAKDPADRFPSATEVADLLGQCLAHVQQPSVVPLPVAVSLSPASVPTSPPARPPKLGCLIALAVFVGVALVIGLRDTLWEVMIKSGLFVLVYILASTPVLLVVHWIGKSRATTSAQRFLWDLGSLFVLMGTVVGLLEWWGSGKVWDAVQSHLIGLVLSSVVVNLPHLPGWLEKVREVARSWRTPAAGPTHGPSIDGRTAAALGVGYFVVVVGLLASAFAKDLAPSSDKRVLWLSWLLGVWVSVSLIAFGPGVFIARRWWRKRRPEDRRADGQTAIAAGVGIGLAITSAVLFVVNSPGLREGLFGPREARLVVHWDRNAVDRVTVTGVETHELDAGDGWAQLDLPVGRYVVSATKDGRELFREDVELYSGPGRGVSIFEAPAPGSDFAYMEVKCDDPTLDVYLGNGKQMITMNRRGQSSVVGQPLWSNERYTLQVFRGHEELHREVVRMRPGEQRDLVIPRIVLPERTVALQPDAGWFASDVVRMEFAPDRSAVAVGRFDGPVLVFDAATGKERFRIGRPRTHSTAFGFTADSKRIAYLVRPDGDSEHVLRWVDANDGRPVGKELRQPNGHTFHNSHVLAFSPDGKWLAAGTATNADTPSGWRSRVLRWELNPDGTVKREIDWLPWEDGMVQDLQFTADGSELVAVSGTTVVSGWSWMTGQESLRTDFTELVTDLLAVGRAHAAAAGRVKTSGQATVADWRTDGGRDEDTSNPPIFPVALASLALSPDDRLLAAGTKGLASVPWEQRAAVRVWDRKTGREPCILIGHTDWPLDLAFTADGKELLSASKDGTVRYWKLP